MIEAHLKELDIDAARAESNKQFWEDLATIGAVGLAGIINHLSNKE